MKIIGIPYERLIIQSSMSPDQVSKCLEDMVWKHSPFWFGGAPKDKLFVGSFSRVKFCLQRISASNLFKPTFYGTIDSNLKGSEIRVTITFGRVESVLVLLMNFAMIYASVETRSPILIAFFLGLQLILYVVAFLPDTRFFRKRFFQELEIVIPDESVR